MHYVNKAIIMAAGKGNRMQPITLTTPKPMIRVNGIRMIDTIIQALHKNGIFEIYIVVGYLKEQFKVLEKEYTGITLIENPYYEECNNISSLYVAREHIGNSIIIDGDQIIKNPTILASSFERSGYNCIWTDRDTKEWLLQTDANGIVTSCNRTGGKKGWQLFSVSRWSEEDGQKLRSHLEKEFICNKNQKIYWDDVALFCYPDQYELAIYPMNWGDMMELDSLEELVSVDFSYQNYMEDTKND